MKILITGNMGYVGPVLVEHLRAQHDDIHISGVDLGLFSTALVDGEVLPERNVDVQYFRDVRTLDESFLAAFDVVVHLAAISNDPMGDQFAVLTNDVNHVASINLARAAKAAGVKAFVFASSCSVYGVSGTSSRTEKSDVEPLSAYARSKVDTENGLAPLASANFKVTCLRFATACGASPRLRLDLVLNDFVACAVTTREITILSDGTPWRPLISVQDMNRAINWAIGRDVLTSGDFLIVNGGSTEWNFQVKDLASLVASQISGTRITYAGDGAPDKRSYQVDFSLYEGLSGIRTKRDDIRETIDALASMISSSSTITDSYRNSHFIRLHQLKDHIESGRISTGLEWINAI